MIIYKLERATYFQAITEDDGSFALYNGAHEWPAYAVFAIRTAILVFGKLNTSEYLHQKICVMTDL
jgi:hypothetical protein